MRKGRLVGQFDKLDPETAAEFADVLADAPPPLAESAANIAEAFRLHARAHEMVAIQLGYIKYCLLVLILVYAWQALTS